jgi:predicted anti-sigma-YlaC factor YlaD
MDCTHARELASARVDGELTASEAATLDRHLVRCVDCRAFGDRAHSLRRDALAIATEAPDVSAAVMARIATEPRQRWTRARVALACVGGLEVGFAIQALFADSVHGHEIHRHSAFMYLALAAGFLAAALRPSRSASGVLPVTGVLLVCLLVSSGLDLAEGGVTALAVTIHAVCTIGFVVSWMLARVTARPAVGFAG